jgi:hypothetical protein
MAKTLAEVFGFMEPHIEPLEPDEEMFAAVQRAAGILASGRSFHRLQNVYGEKFDEEILRILKALV